MYAKIKKKNNCESVINVFQVNKDSVLLRILK